MYQAPPPKEKAEFSIPKVIALSHRRSCVVFHCTTPLPSDMLVTFTSHPWSLTICAPHVDVRYTLRVMARASVTFPNVRRLSYGMLNIFVLSSSHAAAARAHSQWLATAHDPADTQWLATKLSGINNPNLPLPPFFFRIPLQCSKASRCSRLRMTA